VRGSAQKASSAVNHGQEQAEEFLSVCCRWCAVVIATTADRREAVVFQSTYRSLLGSLRQLLGYLHSSSRRRPTQKTLKQAQCGQLVEPAGSRYSTCESLESRIRSSSLACAGICMPNIPATPQQACVAGVEERSPRWQRAPQ
jgi:hypothetical protein